MAMKLNKHGIEILDWPRAAVKAHADIERAARLEATNQRLRDGIIQQQQERQPFYNSRSLQRVRENK